MKRRAPRAGARHPIRPWSHRSYGAFGPHSPDRRPDPSGRGNGISRLPKPPALRAIPREYFRGDRVLFPWTDGRERSRGDRVARQSFLQMESVLL